MLLPDLTTGLTVALLLFTAWPVQHPNQFGRAHWAGRFIALLLLSPGLRYFSTLFTFPIRLQLTAWAGSLLQLMGVAVQPEGNVLVLDGTVMSVDPACMGLQMTGVSLLVALFLLIWQESQSRKRVSLSGVGIYCLTVFGLTILCNLFRIVLLVLFRAMPDSWAHELVGLACVAVYAWLPAWGLAQLLIRWFGKIHTASILSNRNRLNQSILSVSRGVVMLVLGLAIRAYSARQDEPVGHPGNPATWQRYGLSGAARYQCSTLANGFSQLTKPGVLIYLKPQPDWFSADHSPMTCWRGSGYELRHIRETTLNGHPAYIGELHKQGKTLHTAWWFSNGQTTTISQVAMRWRILQGESGFVLVNVTVAHDRLLSKT